MTQKHPIEIIREGSIAASIWERDGKHGRYFDYTLSRSYKTDEGFAYSMAFHERDAEKIGRVIIRAAEAIRKRSGNSMPSEQESQESSSSADQTTSIPTVSDG